MAPKPLSNQPSRPCVATDPPVSQSMQHTQTAVEGSKVVADLRESLAQCQSDATAARARTAGESRGGEAQGGGAWLTIVIPSVSRGETDYVSVTINSILKQIPTAPGDPRRSSVRILVVDNTPQERGEHTALDQLRQQHSSNPLIEFHVQPKAGRTDEGNDPDHANKPGARVRRQTKDLVYTLRQADSSSPSHIFVMEDDFYLCPHALDALFYIIDKAYKMDDDWLAMKVSYGFNGILLRSKDVEPFASYLLQHYRRRPPDHLQTEWWAGETAQSKKYKSGRSYFVFRYNLLEHIGVQSSLRAEKMVGFGVCGQEMNTELMFPVDAFDAKKCGKSDMCPCNRDDGDQENLWSFMANPDRKSHYVHS